jgi:hypothetical protein
MPFTSETWMIGSKICAFYAGHTSEQEMNVMHDAFEVHYPGKHLTPDLRQLTPEQRRQAGFDNSSTFVQKMRDALGAAEVVKQNMTEGYWYQIGAKQAQQGSAEVEL